jgi:WD40 repeat protein
MPVVAAGGYGDKVRMWRLDTGERIGPALGGHSSSVTALTAVAVGSRRLVCSGDGGGWVRLWDAASGQLAVPAIGVHRDERQILSNINGLTTARIDGQPTLISCGADKTVRLWDPLTGRPSGAAHRVYGGVDTLTTISLAGRQMVVTGGEDVRLSDLRSGKQVSTSVSNRGWVAPVTSIANGADWIIISASKRDLTVRTWDMASRVDYDDMAALRASS